jgi:hypothetical protein
MSASASLVFMPNLKAASARPIENEGGKTRRILRLLLAHIIGLIDSSQKLEETVARDMLT